MSTMPASAEGPRGPAATAPTVFAVVYRAGPAWRRGEPTERQDLRDHFLYLRELHRQGTVVIAGPLGDAGGLVLLRVGDLDAARRIATDDPAVRSRVFVAEVEPFTPRIGRLRGE